MKEILNPRGTKEFAYSTSGNVTEYQQYFINIIEFAFKNINLKFKGSNSREAYKFIGTYKKRVEHNKKTGAIYTIINGNKKFVGYYNPYSGIEFEASDIINW